MLEVKINANSSYLLNEKCNCERKVKAQIAAELMFLLGC